MPIFEYRCPKGHIVEELVPANKVGSLEARSTPCTVCSTEGEINLAEKIASPTQTTFKHNDRTAFKGHR